MTGSKYTKYGGRTITKYRGYGVRTDTKYVDIE